MVRCFHFGEGLGAALEHGDWIGRYRFRQESSLGLFSFFLYFNVTMQLLVGLISVWHAPGCFRLVFPLSAPLYSFKHKGCILELKSLAMQIQDAYTIVM
jgi:hypothetical protein